MKTKTLSLTLAALVALPGLALAQGTYLSDPTNAAIHPLVVAPGGNIGIGTTNPVGILDVRPPDAASGGGSSVIIKAQKGAANYGGGNLLLSSGDNGVDSANGYIGFGIGATVSGSDFSVNEKMRISNGGNVGIGTKTPQAKLDVVGSLMCRTDFLMREDAAPMNQKAWRQYVDSATYYMATLDDNNNNENIVYQVVRSGQSVSSFSFRQGNVGIGTTSPQAKLHVHGSAIFDDPGGNIRVTKTSGQLNNDDLGIWNKSGGGGQLFAIADWSTGTKGIFLNTSSGDVGIGTTTPQAKLDVNGKINCTVLELTSDRNAKAGFAAVDNHELLQKVARLPLSTWHYTNAPGVRHLGPTAQDFQAAFQLGTDDKHIATVDADGVLFASVQALHEELQETKVELAAKDNRIAALEQKLAQMDAFATRLAAVEKMFARADATAEPVGPQKSSNPGVFSALQADEGKVP